MRRLMDFPHVLDELRIRREFEIIYLAHVEVDPRHKRLDPGKILPKFFKDQSRIDLVQPLDRNKTMQDLDSSKVKAPKKKVRYSLTFFGPFIRRKLSLEGEIDLAKLGFRHL